MAASLALPASLLLSDLPLLPFRHSSLSLAPVTNTIGVSEEKSSFILGREGERERIRGRSGVAVHRDCLCTIIGGLDACQREERRSTGERKEHFRHTDYTADVHANPSHRV